MSEMSLQWCRHVDRVSMTRTRAMPVALLLLLFFLGLALLGYLGTYSSVPVHIHPHWSRARLIIGNWWNSQRTMFIVGLVHTRDNDLMSIWVWPTEPAAKPKGLICMPLKQEWNHDRGFSSPHLVPYGLRWIWNRSCANCYKHVHILKAISFPRPDVSCIFIIYYGCSGLSPVGFHDTDLWGKQ